MKLTQKVSGCWGRNFSGEGKVTREKERSQLGNMEEEKRKGENENRREKGKGEEMKEKGIKVK